MSSQHNFDCSIDGLAVNADFAVQCNDILLAAGLFDHSKTKVMAVTCKMGFYRANFGHKQFNTSKEEYDRYFERIPMTGVRDHFYYGLAVNERVGKDFIITTESDKVEDFYNFLMANYKLPLLKEWIPEIVSACESDKYLFQEWNAVVRGSGNKIPLHGRLVNSDDIVVYMTASLDNDRLSQVVSNLLRKKKIWITREEIPHMDITSFDEYIGKYGKSLVQNLEKQIEPLSPLNGDVSGLALKNKRLYPQQAACVNGIIALKRKGIKYGIMNEGMGTGKTCQGASVVEAYLNEEFLRRHPDKTLRDCYEKGAVNYRNIIMAPGHLVEKWAQEIEEEIPLAKAVILNDFSQLIELRDKGRARNGKEFYILSKDFAKLGEQNSPIPTLVRKVYPSVEYCASCHDDRGVTIYRRTKKDGTSVCPDCGGKKFKKIPLKYMGRFEGLLCPQCNELLVSTEAEKVFCGEKEPDEVKWVLGPADFARRTSINSKCYHCGCELWGVNSKPLDCGGEFSPWVQREKKWRKISFFKNHHKKVRSTAWTLKGYTADLLGKSDVIEPKKIDNPYGPRKSAPSRFIKKYLKGYFDFAILDEVHKYEGAGTAQANAAHALIKASDFAIGLTGTIANGSAGAFYYLLWMLEPKRMRDKGYNYSSSYMEFVQQYGSIESVFEYDGSSVTYNSNSRGRQLCSPKVKPGISPMLFVDFLLDRCVFLDITDLSKFLPHLEEEVVICNMPSDVAGAYRHTIDVLKKAAPSDEGRAMMAQILNFGLSYPDKPYGRKNIMSAYQKDLTVARIKNFPEYEGDVLLPKEEKLVEIVKDEISQDRCCFVYASYTGEAETNITRRLQSIIEKHCNLKGHVAIIESQSPAPLKREAWIKQKAADGVKVFITNPKCVETGLDFCFKYNGKLYNYPTLIFMQMSYEMSVIWQASRRHYRLNQRSLCKTYYLAYAGTLQTAALEIMAAKQVATSAIQGKFSSEGLAAMAKGVDTRTQLAAALSKGDMSDDRDSLENMFDALNVQNNSQEEDVYGEYIPPKTYWEVIGREPAEERAENEDIFSAMERFSQLQTAADTLDSMYEVPPSTSTEDEGTPKESRTVTTVTDFTETAMAGDLFEAFNSAFNGLSSFDSFGETTVQTSNVTVVEGKKKKNNKKKKVAEGQMSLLDLFAAV